MAGKHRRKPGDEPVIHSDFNKMTEAELVIKRARLKAEEKAAAGKPQASKHAKPDA